MKESKRKININPDQTSRIITVVINKKSGGWSFRSIVTEGGCGLSMGERSQIKTYWDFLLSFIIEED